MAVMKKCDVNLSKYLARFKSEIFANTQVFLAGVAFSLISLRARKKIQAKIHDIISKLGQIGFVLHGA